MSLSTVIAEVVEDLTVESAELAQLVANLTENQWRSATPAPGWSIAHQIAHLTWTDQVSLLSATESHEEFNAVVKKAWTNPLTFVDDEAATLATMDRVELLQQWNEARKALAAALLNVPEGVKLNWFGPPMSATSMATARLMETWAHGCDVRDALGIATVATKRLKAIAHLGVKTRNFAYQVNQLEPPATKFRVELCGPAGEIWTFGEPAAQQSVTGSALDFCFLVTQRRHQADLDLVATGSDAQKWLTIAQAFAGAPGNGREATAS